MAKKKKRDPMEFPKEKKLPADGIPDGDGHPRARKENAVERKMAVMEELRALRKKRQDEERQLREDRMRGLVPTLGWQNSGAPSGPKPYDWKAIFIEAYRIDRNKLTARRVAEVSYSAARNAYLDDPIFRAALEEIDAEWLMQLEVEADKTHEALSRVAMECDEVNLLTGGIEAPRVRAAELILKAHKPQLFGERARIEVDAGASLAGAVMQAISAAAAKMIFDAIPEAQAEVLT